MKMKPLPTDLLYRPFSLREAAEHGVNRYMLTQLISNGLVEQLARGVYRAHQDDVDEEDQYRIATLRVGKPSAICLISALSHYGITDAIPKKTWLMVPMSKRTRHGDLKLLRTRNPHWNIGIREENGYSVTSIERTIVDCLNYRARIGTQIGIDALRKAVGSRKTTLGKIMDIATKLGIDHRIRSYIEALS